MKVNFLNNAKINLAANLDLPKGQPVKAYAMFAHCFTCSKNLNAVRNISKALNAEGIGLLRFDFAGLGQSDGEFEDTNFSSNIDDLISASQFLTDNYKAPKIIIGHSLGGAAVLFAAKLLPSIEAIATIGAPFGPGHIKHMFTSSIDKINNEGEAQVSIGGRPFKVKKQFIDDVMQADIQVILKDLKKALLILHSPQDTIVEIENATKIYTAAHHPKSFISLDGADHLLSNKSDSRYVGQVISSWASRYINIEDAPIQRIDLHQDATISVHLQGDTFTTDIYTSDHHFIADEPTSLGGLNLGPNPFDLLLSSLGTCTAMTLRMYINRKKWNISSIKIHLRSSQDDEGYNIHRGLEIEGNIDETQLKRLHVIANKCPVHKTITGDIKVKPWDLTTTN